MVSKKPVTSFLREIAVVVIGILIALFLNNWNENRKDRRFSEQLLYAVEQEVRISQEDVQRVMELHLERADSLENYLEDDELSLRELIADLGGIQIPEVKNIGLRFFIANKAELVDYQIISDLLEIEFGGDTFQMKMNKLLDFAYERIESTDAESKVLFVVYLYEVIDGEKNLLQLYDEFLEKNVAVLQDTEE